MIADALAAALEIFTPPFRAALVRILALTLVLLAVGIGALHRALVGLVALPYPWLGALVSVLAGLGLVVGSVFLVAPVSTLVAGFFVDDLAATVERAIDPGAAPGRPLPFAGALALAIRFTLLSLAVLLLALALLLVPGVNAVAFVGANAYLLGRQYFEFVALRHLSGAEAQALRRQHGPRIFAAGLFIAGFVALPLLNLLTPMFGTALMVRVFKRLPRPADPRR